MSKRMTWAISSNQTRTFTVLLNDVGVLKGVPKAIRITPTITIARADVGVHIRIVPASQTITRTSQVDVGVLRMCVANQIIINIINIKMIIVRLVMVDVGDLTRWIIHQTTRATTVLPVAREADVGVLSSTGATATDHGTRKSKQRLPYIERVSYNTIIHQ